MDKLTPTRSFWIQLGIFLGRYWEEMGMSEYRFIQRKRFSMDSKAIEIGIEEEEKTEDFPFWIEKEI